MNKYRDFDNYLKEYPSTDGYFGKYGGNYLEDPELIKAFNEYAEAYNTIAQSAQFIAELRRIRRDFQGRPEVVAVVEVEVEGQRQGAALTLHRLAFKGEGRKRLTQRVEFGLIVSSFQDKRVLWHKITNNAVNIIQKS